MPMSARESIIGTGVYSVSDAARFACVHRQRIRRWIVGYSYAYKKELRRSPAIWKRQHADIGGETALGFLDLMEIRALDRFVEAGVSWPTLRAVAQKAMVELQVSHPFCTRRFRTDGRTVFFEYLKDNDEHRLLDFLKNQHTFEAIIAPYLVDVDFDKESRPSRWWPMGKDDSVFLDPDYSFGAPVIMGYGIPTSALYSSFQAEGSVSAVASWWEVSADAVSAAIRFEKKFAA